MRAPLALLLLLLAQSAAADSWPGPQTLTVFSSDGSRFVRVTPGESLGDVVGFAGEKRGAYARGSFFERAADRSYQLSAEVPLLNPIAPIDLLLSNTGYLITFDNWHNAGYGKAVAIYGPTGGSVAAWELEQLYAPDQLAAIQRSVSSRWWRCAPFHFVDPQQQSRVYVRESLGGYFVFDLAAGSFDYSSGSAECQPPARPAPPGSIP